MTDGEKIKTIRKALSLTQEAFGEPLGITKGHISDVEKNKKNFSKSALELLKVRFAISDNWWETGEGEMFAEPTGQEAKTAYPNLDKYPELKLVVQEVIEKYKGLNLEGRLDLSRKILQDAKEAILKQEGEKGK